MRIIITESQMRTIVEGSYKKYSVNTDVKLSDILNCHIKYDEKYCFKDFKSRVKVK